MNEDRQREKEGIKEGMKANRIECIIHWKKNSSQFINTPNKFFCAVKTLENTVFIQQKCNDKLSLRMTMA